MVWGGGGGASGLAPSRRMFVLGGDGGGVMIVGSFLVRFFPAGLANCILLPNLRSNDSRDRYVNIAQDLAAASPAVGLASSV